jgi:acyl-CoA synthetase (AMP-forming)/AMP-acid ligase II
VCSLPNLSSHNGAGAKTESQMSTASTFWGKQIAVETIGGVPYRMYKDRPRRIEHLLPFAQHWGSRPYIVQGERVLTFEALLRASAEKARALGESGVGRGDRVFINGWNSPDWVLNFWACVRLGAVPVLANAWWSESELGHALNLLRPVVVLADARGVAKLTAQWRQGPWEVDERSSASCATADMRDHDAVSANENEPAAIIFTSGTEGRAKAVVLAHRSLLAQLQMMLHVTHHLPYQPDRASGEVCLHTGPLFHIGGVHAVLRGVTVGNTLVMLRGRFEPSEALELIERHRISRWNAVPTMASRLLEHPDASRRDLRTLRSVALGGAPVHSELMRQVRSGLPGAQSRVATGYGLSENSGQATAAGGADTVAQPGSSGRPLPCVELRMIPRPGMSDGEVLVRSPTQMLGYFAEAESPIDSDGWLHTGDLGYVDAEGRLWITGRCKDIIIRGGENISPAAVERALTALAGVTEAAVFGVPHPDLGEEVMAVVVVNSEVTLEQLQGQLRMQLASFAVPSRWRLQTEPLPVNQTGKVDKAALIALARADCTGKANQAALG